MIEWGALAATLGFTALLIANFVWSEQRLVVADETERMQSQARIIEENLAHQFQGVRHALESARSALGEDSGCTASCQRLLLQSLKRAMPGCAPWWCSMRAATSCARPMISMTAAWMSDFLRRSRACPRGK
jgi:hypothetical protein